MTKTRKSEDVYTKINAAYQIIEKKWMCAIICCLLKEPKRFSEINSKIPELSNRMLTERVKELEDIGIVFRQVITDRPIRTEYSLTQKGQDLGKALKPIQDWAKHWL